MNDVAESLREIGLENRIEILKLLEQEPRSLPEIKRHLKYLGFSKPHTTVARCLDRLLAMKLVREEGGRFILTNQGCLLLQYCEELGRNLSTLNAMGKYPNMETLSLLPKEFLKEIWLLEDAEVIEDVYSGLARALKASKEAKEKMLVLTWLANLEATELNLLRALEGVKLFAVIESSTIPLRMDIKRKLEIPLKLSDAEVRAKLSKNFHSRKYANLPLQLMVSDSSKAGIQLVNPTTQALSPYFISDRIDFIQWAERIFDYYWKRSEPIEIY